MERSGRAESQPYQATKRPDLSDSTTAKTHKVGLNWIERLGVLKDMFLRTKVGCFCSAAASYICDLIWPEEDGERTFSHTFAEAAHHDFKAGLDEEEYQTSKRWATEDEEDHWD